MKDKEYWDLIANSYDELYLSDWYVYEDKIQQYKLKDLLVKSTNPKILDLGCGQGLGFELISNLNINFKYHGIDLSNQMINLFNSKGYENIELKVGCAEEITKIYKDQNFDFIIAINVSASFPKNTMLLLQSTYKLLKPGGCIYLSFLNKWSFRRIVGIKVGNTEFYKTRCESVLEKGVEAKVFTKGEMDKLLRKNGFSNISFDYHSVLGGLWETKWSVCLEKFLIRILPIFGHAINVTATKED